MPPLPYGKYWGTEIHRKRYKVAADADEGRRRRKDNLVEIRKSKREESLLKRSVVNVELVIEDFACIHAYARGVFIAVYSSNRPTLSSSLSATGHAWY